MVWRCLSRSAFVRSTRTIALAICAIPRRARWGRGANSSDGEKTAVRFQSKSVSTRSTLRRGYVLASIIDITERRRAELEAARQRDELAHLSRVALLGELSGSLAHELNQPLAAILFNAQAAQLLLMQNASDPAELQELQEILREIVDENKRAGEVIRRLRTLLRKG